MDDSVDKVVVDEVLADLLLRAAAVHDAEEKTMAAVPSVASQLSACMMNARSALDFGASTPAGEKRGSLMSVALLSPSHLME